MGGSVGPLPTPTTLVPVCMLRFWALPLVMLETTGWYAPEMTELVGVCCNACCVRLCVNSLKSIFEKSIEVTCCMLSPLQSDELSPSWALPCVSMILASTELKEQ